MSNRAIESYPPHVQEQIRRKLAQQLPAGARTEGMNAAALHAGESLNSTGPGTEAFVEYCVSHRLSKPVPEYTFAHPRRWRFDYAWPDFHVALEVEGGVWTHGRHTRGSGFVKDIEKYNAAVLLGWHVLRVVPKELFTRKTVDMIDEFMGHLAEWRGKE